MGHWGPSQTAFGLMRFSRDLPPERRDAVRKHLKEARQGLKALRADLRTARQKAAEVLGSQSFAPEQFQSALEAIGSAEGRMRDTGAAAVAKAVGELAPDERQRLAEAWKRRFNQEHRRKGQSDGSAGSSSEGVSEGPPDPP